MQIADHIPRDPENEEWDVIVVGTGMGGSTAGYELARLGRRVLFLEKGKFLHAGPVPDDPDSSWSEEALARLREGRWPVPLEGRTSFGDIKFYAPMGCGSGGSTAVFGAQLERFSHVDFRPRSNFPNVRDANLPEQWPISYEEFVPFYRRAEALYRVCGTPDPLNPDPEASLRPPPSLSERDQVLFDSLEGLGLHPYRSHVGFHHIPDCRECFGVCPWDCKGDAGGRSLVPALSIHGANILPECDALELNATRSRVTGVRARWKGRELRLRGRVILLASGAFMTPRLLLESRSAEWSNGLANRSGLVGRNLMLHASDFLTIDHRKFYAANGPKKSLSFNDFYINDGTKLGTLQAVGLPILAPFILSYLRFAEVRDPQWWRRPMSRLLPLVSRIASHHFRRAGLFATIVEDLPYLENRVVPDARATNGMRFEYTYTRDFLERNRLLRKQLARRLAPKHRVRIVTGGVNNINYGHVCGTCRFGDNPATSVLDRANRAHDLDNLYVVDASFFPSSGGINPSLTIAANGIRVGGLVHGALP